jgi:hypothetical protein
VPGNERSERPAGSDSDDFVCSIPGCQICEPRRSSSSSPVHIFAQDGEIRRRERLLFDYGRPASGFNSAQMRSINLPARERQSDAYNTMLRSIYSTRNIEAAVRQVPLLERQAPYGWQWVDVSSISEAKAWFSTFAEGWRQVAIAHTAAVYMMEVHVDGNRITNAAAILKYAGLEKEAGDSK